MTTMAIRPDVESTPPQTYREFQRQQTCGEKVRYSAEWLAENARTALCWAQGEDVGMHAYYCKFCDHYHLGHNTGEEKMQIKPRPVKTTKGTSS